jgi:hypothetical protein
MDHGGRSNSGVVGAAGVQQKRCNAHSSIEVAVVKTKRHSANSSIPASGRIAEKRILPNGCIAGTTGEAKERETAFGCGKPGVAAVWRWAHCEHLWQKRERAERQYYCNGSGVLFFHKFSF